MAAARQRGSSAADDSDKPRSDVYTGLLILSLLAMISASALVFLDYNQFPPNKLPTPQLPASGGAPPLGPPLPGR